MSISSDCKSQVVWRLRCRINNLWDDMSIRDGSSIGNVVALRTMFFLPRGGYFKIVSVRHLANGHFTKTAIRLTQENTLYQENFFIHGAGLWRGDNIKKTCKQCNTHYRWLGFFIDCECSLQESHLALKMICNWTSEAIGWPVVISGESYKHDSHEFC